ncbi:MAG: LytR/AlgR family response regulator transcription factor [Luteibaculum sp.]
MRISICEDEVIVAEHLRAMVSQLGYKVIGLENDYEACLAMLKAFPPDLALLDIRMDREDAGFRLAEHLKSEHIPFVFISAHSDDNALGEAANLNPLGYIVKPFNLPQIKATLKQAEEKTKRSAVYLKVGHETIRILKDSILYIKSDDKYCELYTEEGRHLIRNSLSNVLEELEADFLLRVHRSYAVNEGKITRKEGQRIYLGEQEIPISRSFKF